MNDVSAMILPKNETGRVPAVFVFGDSIVDTGTNKCINTILKCNLNFPRYGSDFKGRKPTGSRKGGANDGKKGTQQRNIKRSDRHGQETKTQQHYHWPEKSGSNTIKGEGDAQLMGRDGSTVIL
uniref:GDSL esterase/lipase n=1 Tax=Quercus lobata TaxID=97700 RepID=A0A7N2M124_QUELO